MNAVRDTPAGFTPRPRSSAGTIAADVVTGLVYWLGICGSIVGGGAALGLAVRAFRLLSGLGL